MKLRQKLAVVLASAMAVTAVPVVTMADSSNRIVNTMSIAKKDTKTTSEAIKIKFEDGTNLVKEEFYLTLTNAEWLQLSDSDLVNETVGGSLTYAGNLPVNGVADDCDSAYILGQIGKNGITDIKYQTEKSWIYTIPEGQVRYTKQSDTVMKVEFVPGAGAGASFSTSNFVTFPMPLKLKGGVANVALTAEGGSSTITEGNFNIASTGEKAADLTVEELKSFYDEGELSAITLKETFVGSMKANDMILKIKLEDTDFEFEQNSNVKVEGSYGFNFKAASRVTDGSYTKSNDINFEIDKNDKSVAYVRIDKDLIGGNTNSLGRIKITGIRVESDEDDLATGDLLADITTVKSLAAADTLSGNSYNTADDNKANAELDKDYTDRAIAKIAKYGAYIKMKDEKAVNIIAGREEEVVFEVIENVDDVFVGSRTIKLTLKDDKDATDKSFFMISDAQFKNPLSILDNDDSKKIVQKIEFVLKDDADRSNGNIYDQKDMYRVTAIKVQLKNADGDNDDLNDNDKIDKFKIKTKVYVPVDQQDKKTVQIVGEESYGIKDFTPATAVNVVDPFDVTFDKTTFKVGLQDQPAGKIEIAEKDKAMFMKGVLKFVISDGTKAKNIGMDIEEKGNLTVTGDLKKADLGDIDSKTDKVTFKRESKSASTLKIDGMKVTVDRTVPEGFYDLKLFGDAIDKYDGSYVVNDYVVIGTQNTDDLENSNGLSKGTATFVIGESKYVLNNIEYAMDAPSYIQDPGYTMVSVKYVANAFGVNNKDIIFDKNKGTVTIFAGDRTVQLTKNSNVAIVNGANVTMGTKVVIKDGRTYAPAGEIARVLGIKTAWDSATKTATFEN